MNTEKFEAEIIEISKTYFLVLKKINANFFSSGDVDETSPFYLYYLDVEKTFSELKSEYKRIINNEYFYQAFSNWWISDYTPQEFKKAKRLAIKSFLEVFHEIH